VDDEAAMDRAVELAASVRGTTSPNPWVGCVLLGSDGSVLGEGTTAPPGGLHAEAAALAQARSAGRDTNGATAVTTLEPCSHQGRTPPCADALIHAGVARVVAAIEDPDRQVAGRGTGRLRAAGITVDIGPAAAAVESQLAPYLVHRRTGRPLVILKLAASLDCRTAAPDGTSQWITGPEARADAHSLRAESDAVLVGAGTVRADNPSLTVRHVEGRDPLRVVLGHAPDGAAIHPCLELGGDLGEALDQLGGKGVLQLLVEGGPTVAAAFHRAALVDRYVFYLAPALFGGDDARGPFTGPGAASIDDVWRGRIVGTTSLGGDLRIDLLPATGPQEP